ncbi:unnamed protein product [Cylicostephanus goldi]|uniref:Membrane magnesium transporter n=1 Tax=Cylicostephanus goldi TaxID=71465 RepID=A0A3P6UQF6_CYLGO|nr:unnamed protein product [Cylicostephanus goldi]
MVLSVGRGCGHVIYGRRLRRLKDSHFVAMSKTLYNVITLASLASLLHCAYSAAQHRSYLRLTEQPFISLPADVLAQTIISLIALIYGATHVAGAFQHIKSDPVSVICTLRICFGDI